MTNVACQPTAHHERRQPRRVPGAPWAARLLARSSIVLGVAAYLASAAPACAEDKAPPKSAHARKMASVAPPRMPLLPLRSEAAVLLPMTEPSPSTSSAPATGPDAGTTAAATATAPGAAVPAPNADGQTCEQDCPSKRKSAIALLPEVILRNINEVPLLAAFFMPVTEGVTITPAEGLPAVTFTVKPTKITRGSGLVAVSRF
jgi:hypothetical protein